MRFAAAAGLVALLLACRHVRAAEAGPDPADEPSIQDMLAEIKARKKRVGSPGAEPVDSRPGSPRPSVPRPPAPRPSSKPVKLSQSVEKEIKRLQTRARQCRKALARHKGSWEMVQLYNRLEQYKMAAKVLSPMLRGKPPARSTDAVRAWEWGQYHLEYAFVMKHLGQEATVKAMLAEHKRRLDKARANPIPYRRPQSYHLKPIVAKLTFFENYDEAKAQVDALAAELAGGRSKAAAGGRPGDAERLWKTASLCKPGKYEAELPLKWFATIHDLIAKHPDQELVRSGKVHWELQQAYHHHRMYEDSVKVLTMMLDRFPDFPEVRKGNCLWALADNHEALGRLSEAVGDRTGATAAYQKAIETYRGFKKRFPEDWRSKPYTNSAGNTSAPTTDRAVGRIQEYLARLGG